ncbi:MAG TPA: type II CAAX endopeptidase family protein, partial [Microlunatus sp.]|nr:type II CAAX endopeptidase family protein [Microlunatus sp.]
MAKKGRSRSGNPAVRARPAARAAARAAASSRPAVARTGSADRRPGYDPQLPEALPPDGASYPQILRGGSYVWWRSLLGVVFGLSLYLLLTAVITQVVLGVSWGLVGAGQAYADWTRRALDFEVPAGMIAANLGIATLIPICWVLMAIVHQVRPRWLSSVQPRLRWRYLLISAGVAFVVLNGVTLIPMLVTGSARVSPQPGFWAFLVVILLTAPLQAAGEEYFFRGYLMQALGSLVAHPAFGVVVSAVLFALMHGTQNPALFVNRLGFGLLAALLVWRTGGLEASIGAHVINNICAYVIAGLTSSISAVRGISSVSWTDSAIQLGGFALFAAIALLVARGLK